jgi:hypothetical protein
MRRSIEPKPYFRRCLRCCWSCGGSSIPKGMSRRLWTLGERGLLVEQGNCRGSAATIIVDTQAHHPWAEQTARGTRILFCGGSSIPKGMSRRFWNSNVPGLLIRRGSVSSKRTQPHETFGRWPHKSHSTLATSAGWRSRPYSPMITFLSESSSRGLYTKRVESRCDAVV